jgi:hypothetical protein
MVYMTLNTINGGVVGVVQNQACYNSNLGPLYTQAKSCDHENIKVVEIQFCNRK